MPEGSEGRGPQAAAERPVAASFHVYKHSGDPEGGLIEDEALRSGDGFPSARRAAEVTRDLFPDMHLVMLRGRYSGAIVAVRRAGRSEWSFLAREELPA
jgi:hypothetical protein